jgi:hypothetical protein
MMRSVLAAIAAVVLAASAVKGADTKPDAKADAKLKKPKLDMRATPRMGFSPINVLVVAELQGGDDIEEYYCPEIEWDWDDGGKSQHEADCPPFEAGVTKIERRFSSEHYYPRAGVYNVKASFKRNDKVFLANTLRLTVRAGIGDQENAHPQ